MSSQQPQQTEAGGARKPATGGAPAPGVADGVGSAQLEASLAALSAVLACMDTRSPNVPLSAPGQAPIPPPQVGLANVLPALLAPLAPLPSSNAGPTIGSHGQPAPGTMPGAGQQPAPPFPGGLGGPGVGLTPAQAILFGRRAAFRPQDTFNLCNQLVQSLQNPENETAKAVYLAEKLIAESRGDEAAKAERLLAVRRRRHQEEKEVTGATPDVNQQVSAQLDRARPPVPQLSFPDTLPDPLPDSFSRNNLARVCDSFLRALAGQGQDATGGNGMQLDQPVMPLAKGDRQIKLHLEDFKSVPGGTEACIVINLPNVGAGLLVVRSPQTNGGLAPLELVSVNFRSQREVTEEASLTASSRWHMLSRYPLHREISLQLQSSILQTATVDEASAIGPASSRLWKPLVGALHHIAALRSLYDLAPPRLEQLMTGQAPLTASQGVTREVLYWRGCNVKWACSVPAAQALGVGIDGAPANLSSLPGTWSAHYGLCAMNL